MTDIIEYHLRPDGLGIVIIELCVLLATNKKIHAFVPTQNHMLYDFKRVFNISDDRLTIIYEENSVNDPASNDRMKTFVPYFTADTVRLFGEDYPVGRRNKPCIGLAMHHAGGTLGGNDFDPLGEKRALKDFPFNKFATYDTYSKIIKLITDSGYDVITFNSPKINVEYKSFLLNNLCNCIIGYEGGAIQLAHTLKVPAIVLPWNAWFDGDDHWKSGAVWDPERIESHGYHIDRQTYFLKSQEEIVAWDHEKLKLIIDSLYNNQGNNVFFTNEVTVDIENLAVTRVQENRTLGTIPDTTKDFIRTHIQDPKIG